MTKSKVGSYLYKGRIPYRGVLYDGSIESIASINEMLSGMLAQPVYSSVQEHWIFIIPIVGHSLKANTGDWVMLSSEKRISLINQVTMDVEFVDADKEYTFGKNSLPELNSDPPAKYLSAPDIASNHEEEDFDEVVEIESSNLAWDVIPAKEPVKEIALSTILNYLENGFDRNEIAVMLGHPLESINKLFKRYAVLHNRKPARSNRLPFKVVDDVQEQNQQESLNLN